MTGFAAIETATAANAVAALANCTATIGAVSGVAGIFDNAYAIATGYAAGTAPALIIQATSVPAVAIGNAVTVPAGSFVVTDIEPDGTGLLVLRLDSAT